ncbi:hypothetical protein [Tenacibaculum amylolyticum]|uniref:hypothetical protein n=1 Tax=Tenacibaculum amylolyticum TaxID=104269 RepID=UPI0038956DE4
MQTNNFEKHLVEKLKNRTVTPSESAWERLSAQLDEEEGKNKKKKFFYLGYAASILVVVTLGILFTQRKEQEPIKSNKHILITNVDTTDSKVKEEKTIKEKITVEKGIADNVIQQESKTRKKLVVIKEDTKKQIVLEEQPIKSEAQKEVVKEEELKEKIIPKKYKTPKRIRVNADDLLYAVTHSPEEVKVYYAKYNINRKNVLDTIQKQLRKSNLKIDPEVILAEVENSIEEADFQENFMNKFKSKLSDVIVAIADRNN